MIFDPGQIENHALNVDILLAVNSNYIDHNINTINVSKFLLPEDIQKLNIGIPIKQHQVKKDKFQEDY